MVPREKPSSRIKVGIDKRQLQAIRGPYDQTAESDHDIVLNGMAAFVDRVLYAGYTPPLQDHWMLPPRNEKLIQHVIISIPYDVDARLTRCSRTLKISRIYVVRAAIYDLSRSADQHFRGEQRP